MIFLCIFLLQLGQKMIDICRPLLIDFLFPCLFPRYFITVPAIIKVQCYQSIKIYIVPVFDPLIFIIIEDPLFPFFTSPCSGPAINIAGHQQNPRVYKTWPNKCHFYCLNLKLYHNYTFLDFTTLVFSINTVNQFISNNNFQIILHHPRRLLKRNHHHEDCLHLRTDCSPLLPQAGHKVQQGIHALLKYREEQLNQPSGSSLPVTKIRLPKEAEERERENHILDYDELLSGHVKSQTKTDKQNSDNKGSANEDSSCCIVELCYQQ